MLQVRYANGKCLPEYYFPQENFKTVMSGYAIFTFHQLYAIPMILFICKFYPYLACALKSGRSIRRALNKACAFSYRFVRQCIIGIVSATKRKPQRSFDVRSYSKSGQQCQYGFNQKRHHCHSCIFDKFYLRFMVSFSGKLSREMSPNTQTFCATFSNLRVATLRISP